MWPRPLASNYTLIHARRHVMLSRSVCSGKILQINWIDSWFVHFFFLYFFLNTRYLTSFTPLSLHIGNGGLKCKACDRKTIYMTWLSNNLSKKNFRNKSQKCKRTILITYVMAIVVSKKKQMGSLTFSCTLFDRNEKEIRTKWKKTSTGFSSFFQKTIHSQHCLRNWLPVDGVILPRLRRGFFGRRGW